jgi:hypothetical protein
VAEPEDKVELGGGVRRAVIKASGLINEQSFNNNSIRLMPQKEAKGEWGSDANNHRIK